MKNERGETDHKIVAQYSGDSCCVAGDIRARRPSSDKRADAVKAASKGGTVPAVSEAGHPYVELAAVEGNENSGAQPLAAAHLVLPEASPSAATEKSEVKGAPTQQPKASSASAEPKGSDAKQKKGFWKTLLS